MSHSSSVRDNKRELRLHLLLIAMACALVWSWTYGTIEISTDGEAFLIQVAKDTRDSGAGTPMIGDSPLPQSPIPIWIVRAALDLADGEINLWILRFPSVVFATALVFLTYFIGRSCIGARAALVSVVVLLTTPLFLRQSYMVNQDMLIAACVTLGYWVVLTGPEPERFRLRRFMVFYACIVAAAIAGAGSLRVQLLFLSLIPAVMLEWREWSVRKIIGLTLGVGIFPAFSALWLVATDGYVDRIYEEWFYPFIGRGYLYGSDTHLDPWFYVSNYLLRGGLPWIPLLAIGLFRCWREVPTREIVSVRMISLWFIAPFLYLSAISVRQTSFLLPLLPAAALLVGWMVDKAIFEWDRPRWMGLAFGFFTLALGGGLLTAGIVGRHHLDFFRDRGFTIFLRETVIWIVLGALLIFPGAIALFAKNRAVGAACLLVVAIFGSTLFMAGIEPGLHRGKNTALFAATVESMIHNDGEPVAAIESAGKIIYHVRGNNPILGHDRVSIIHNDSPPILVLAPIEEVVAITESAEYEAVHEMTVVGEKIAFLRRKDSSEADLLASPKDIVRVGLAGDTGTGNRRAYRVAEQMSNIDAAHPLDAVFLLGDNLYGGEPFHLAMDARFIRPYSALLDRKVPFFGALGNHDADAQDRWEGQIHSPLFHMEGRAYYAREIGGLVTFFVLASPTIREDAEQVEWFREEVPRHSTPWKVLVIHRPMDASEMLHGSSGKIHKLLVDILHQEGGIDFVFSGHNHIYERRELLDGIQHITLGSGGKLESEEEFPADENRAVGYKDSGAFGWMSFRREKAIFEAVEEEGQVIDRVTYGRDESSGDLIVLESGPGLRVEKAR